MAKTFYLRVLVAGHADLVCEVRKAEAERFRRRLETPEGHGRFFWFDTIDGRSLIVNLDHVQGVRFLWDVAAAPPNTRLSRNEDMTIAFAGRPLLAEPPSEDEAEIYGLFRDLELDDDEAVTFTDFDGEQFSLLSGQVVYISAPKDVVDEGRRQAEAEDGASE